MGGPFFLQCRQGPTKRHGPGNQNKAVSHASFKKSTSQSAENARDAAGSAFFFFSLAPRISRAYKHFVSSSSSGGLHESTGLRSARKLSTPLLRCESRTNRLKSNSLVKRRSKREKRALDEGPLCFCRLQIVGCGWAAPSALYLSIPQSNRICARLLSWLMRGVLVFAATLFGMVVFVMMF